ncbi:MAG: MBL fold metallo-hydrolase [Myxococcota bacterium]
MDGVDVLALRTPTLPPATTTNTSLVGRRDVWIVDPATPFDEPREVLLGAVDSLEEEGRRPRGIVLTHHHPDHVGATAWLRERLGVPVLAHARTRALLRDSGTPVDEELAEGDVLRGSDGPDDRWEVLHTPGHASGHVVLWEPHRRGMVAGDMVAAEGTVVVEPPDGHMATYVAQLRRLAALGPRWLVPAHGDVIDDPVAVLEGYVAHRLMREGRVLDALAEGPADLRTLTGRSYPELAAALLPLAERSCLAHLVKLEEEGRAGRRDDRWRLIGPGTG